MSEQSSGGELGAPRTNDFFDVFTFSTLAFLCCFTRSLLLASSSLSLPQSSILRIQDPHGNYLVQAVIELEIPEVLSLICDKLKDHFDRLSTQKYGGYVVEKLMQSCMMEVVVSNLVLCRRLGDVARDQYGNYIIQKAWNVTKVLPRLTDREKVVEIMDPSLEGLYSMKEVIHVAAIAAMCVQPEADYRPLMADVVQSLVPLVMHHQMPTSKGANCSNSLSLPNLHLPQRVAGPQLPEKLKSCIQFNSCACSHTLTRRASRRKHVYSWKQRPDTGCY
ncbi:hypothetical protein H6P81_016305 [Aristolochia fimbriata]|uniref:PUM-HD domain-containing protein n=1 Tax=Aristolochia fimbriata TaxID=158543 RepID=A0AAV7E7W2_ARIFI|nr:hypothetical protein H6P81_016305 [Aristolochia fimbriata]